MKPAWSVCGFLACASAPPRPPVTTEPATVTQAFADFDDVAPSYGKPELERALAGERATVAARERAVADAETGDDADALRVALADLGVESRFVGTLEACVTTGRWCPPRLDDPPWRYDLDDDA